MLSEPEHHRLRFLGWGVLFPVLIGLLLMFSVGVADVILSYQVTAGGGSSVATPYYFQDGPNYATAHADGFVTITCSGAALATPTTCGGTATPIGQSTESIVLSGVEMAPSYTVSISEFAINANFPAAGQTFNLGPVLATSTLAGPTCVYAFITTIPPSSPATLSTAMPSSQPPGCGVFEPTMPGGSMEDINLESGAISNPVTGQTGVTYVVMGGAFYTGQTPFGTATVLLYISMVIVSSGTAPSGSAAFFVNPTIV